jgi:hypothetical protein
MVNVNKIMEHRSQGLYIAEETRKEAELCVKQMFAEPTDLCFTLRMADGRFTVLNADEIDTQIMLWKRLGAKVMGENIKEREIAGRKVWMFVVQPKSVYQDEECNVAMCPLGIAMGRMVSGFTYVARSKNVADSIWRRMGSEWISNKMD